MERRSRSAQRRKEVSSSSSSSSSQQYWESRGDERDRRERGRGKERKKERREREKHQDQAAEKLGWGKAPASEPAASEKDDNKEKQKADFGLSGVLNQDSKSGKLYNGTVLKWSEPADAATPTGPGWRIYVFKGKELLDTLHIHRQSAYLFGRDEKIADIVLEDDSCSKQHAVIQFRIKKKEPPQGSVGKKTKYYIRPYIMDLESTNGTQLNRTAIEPSRYIELLDKDVLTFADEPRDFVVMKS